jgi:hypothetical protein
LIFAVSLLAVTVVILAGAKQAQSASDSEWGYSWGETRAKCIKVTAGEYELVFAHVTARMSVRNRGHGAHWVTNFRLKARLIPTTSGLNYTRSWKTNRFPVYSDLLQDYDYSRAMAVNTDTVNPEAEWVVQVKQVWDRKAPWSDIVRQFSLPFDTSHCRQGKLPKNHGGGGYTVARVSS